jgi:hypothetical protein
MESRIFGVIPMESDEIFSRTEAAKFLRVSKATLANDTRHHRFNFPIRRVGRRVLYSKAELLQWLKGRRRRGNSA